MQPLIFNRQQQQKAIPDFSFFSNISGTYCVTAAKPVLAKVSQISAESRFWNVARY